MDVGFKKVVPGKLKTFDLSFFLLFYAINKSVKVVS